MKSMAAAGMSINKETWITNLLVGGGGRAVIAKELATIPQS